MSLINIISVPTFSGLKTIEIHNADITNLDWDIDVLIVSSFHNKYTPAPGTLIWSLEKQLGINLEKLSCDTEIDLRDSLNCWVSKEIKGQKFQRIICVEGIKSSIEKFGNAELALSNLFGTLSVMNHRGIATGSIALTLIGTGFQNNPIEKVLPELIQKAIQTLNSITSLNTIYFIDRESTRSKLIEDTINFTLKRDFEKLESIFEDSSMIPVFDQILIKLNKLNINSEISFKENGLNILITKINEKNLKFYELGILSRRIMENLLLKISGHNDTKKTSLNDLINNLSTKQISKWMITYMHTLRVFGNSVAHEETNKTYPEHMDRSDILVFSHALNRFLDFYIFYCKIDISDNK